jgi:GT2 family glycosyltransferase
MIEATLLLPNFNNERILPFTFEYLRKNVDCRSVRFVMVDDGSEDASVAVAKIEIPRCGFNSAEIIERRHEGIVPSLNAGLEAVNTDFVVRIDGDATGESPGWLPKLLQPLRHTEVGLAGGQILFDDQKVHSFGRSVFSEFGLYDLGCCPLEPVGQRTFDSIVYRPIQGFFTGPIREVDSILGVCAAFRTEDARATGGFDMRFNPVWIEDDDFGLALRKLGKRVVLVPNVRILHRISLRGSRIPGITMHRPEEKMGLLRRFTTPLRKHFLGPLKRSLLALQAPAERRLAISDFIPHESSSWRADVLRSHYTEWRNKWGFHPLNPSVSDIWNQYWDTVFCWRSNPRQLERSDAIVRQLNAA